MFAKLEGIETQMEGSNVRRILRRDLPPSEAICRSAVIALLFLLKSHLSLEFSDVYHLMVETIGHTELRDRPQLLCELSQGMLVVP